MMGAWSVEDRRRFGDGDRLRASTVPAKKPSGPVVDDWGDVDDWVWGVGADEPIVASCDLSNPEVCESCQ